MGIILFLVDTSASMNQKTFLGTSYLDVAKGAIDTFMKYRARDPASPGDHYMLVSFDDPPTRIKVGWENHGNFLTELKNLTATSLSTFSQSLKDSFDLLNVNRLHTGIDHYGQGRNPFFLEPAIVIVITDGGKYNKNSQSVDIEEELMFLKNGISEGSELTKEPFRWDQRLFAVLLQLPGYNDTPSSTATTTSSKESSELPNAPYVNLSNLCEYTGGKCYIGNSLKSLTQCMESISQKLHPGVVLNFRKLGAPPSNETDTAKDPRGGGGGGGKIPLVNGERTMADDREAIQNNSWHNTRKMIFVRPNPKTNVPSGHWPIPESFWPDVSATSLYPRDVHPIVWFDPVSSKPKLIESFAFDKYEMEPSPLTQYILEKRDPNSCWQVYISDCGPSKGVSNSFGYLKASSTGNFVNLFVMPLNYNRLLPLIDELQRLHLRPSAKWRSEFADYLTTIPNYYAQPLRKALQLMGAHPSLVHDSFDGQMSYSITSYLRKLKKQAKLESSKLSAQIQQNKVKSEANNNIKYSLGIVESGGIISGTGESNVKEGLTSQSYRNPFDIPRRSLIGQVVRMRANFLFSSLNTPHLIEEVTKHQIPIGQMGNYQKHLKKINPLRELDTGDVRTQLFGNPFKLERPDKRGADDYGNIADEMMLKKSGSPVRNSRKRKLRSPSPAPFQATPTPDTPKNGKEPKQESSNGVKNSQIDSTQISTEPAEKMEIDEMQPTPIDSPIKAEISPNTPKGSDKAPIILEPLPIDPVVVDKKKDNHVISKRTPSPTSIVLPPSKRPHLDSSLKTPNTENVPKVNNTTPTNSVRSLAPPIRSTGLISSASQVLNEEFKRKQTTENLKIKQLIGKEIRKHSRNYDQIFQHLNSIQGTADTKRAFVNEVIKEAERFRKKQLVDLLNDWTLGLSLPDKNNRGNNIKMNTKKLQTTTR